MSTKPASSFPASPALHGNHSKVIRHQGGFEWQGVALEAYKDTTDTWRGITRREQSGKRGESQAFHVRYFVNAQRDTPQPVDGLAPCYICE